MLAVVPAFAVLLLQGRDLTTGAVLGDAGFALAIITDRYDGMIARWTGQVTSSGSRDPMAREGPRLVPR